MKIKINIDDLEVITDDGKSVLQVALENDIYIPHLCHHPDLDDIGACGLCVVEIDGESDIKSSCETLVKDGMKIRTKTEKLNKMRRLSMELMLSNHVDDCTTCPKYLKCELQSLIQYLGVSTSRLKRTLNAVPVNTKNPLIVRDLNRCVSCGRCVRMCKDVRGVNVLDYEMTEHGRVVVDIKNKNSLCDEDCRFCGACIEVCPTGALQDKEGVFKNLADRKLALTPCKAACPANIDAPRYIRYLNEGKYQEAAAVIREKTVFPYSLGYICMHFCEGECKRNHLDESISIRELKKFAISQDNGAWKEKVTYKDKTGKRVAVVGAGPAGLTAAYYLQKSGHDVTVFEKEAKAGGMLTFGIPDFRLPKNVVDSEIKIIEDSGVKIKTSSKVTDLNKLKNEGFDKILIAVGTDKGVRLPIDGSECENCYENIDFLKHYAFNTPLKTGNDVVVLGGGNVAFDCAMAAKKLGAENVKIVCLESREDMKASSEEIQEALDNGIEIINNRTFLAVESQNNLASGVKCQVVEDFSFDENRRLKLNIKPDSDYVIPADTVIFAVGQGPDIPEEFNIETRRGNLIVTEDGIKINDDLYAVGDAVYGTNSVIRAAAEGRKAAKAIDLSLGGDGCFDDKLAPEENLNPYIGRDEKFLSLNRESSCNSADSACRESSRCLQCDLRTKITKPKAWVNYKVK